ncbi:MAG: hypothetical protein K6T90_21625 [Leptolyngbyaceae cyanobacterium HOT.MB2.61]|nr:hypothetical protein [Leptolyngbyaceae cyanobacterium HOT.MB2.61]
MLNEETWPKEWTSHGPDHLAIRCTAVLAGARTDRPSSPNTDTSRRSPSSPSTDTSGRSLPDTSRNLELLTQI